MNLSQVKNALTSNVAKAAAGAGLLVGASMSQAAGVDVSTVTSALADAATTVGLVGAAALAVVVVVKVFKFIRAAF
jgi:Mg/Co/Ni transporter MgtE